MHLVLASSCPSSLPKDAIIPQYLLGSVIVDQYVSIPVIIVCGCIIQIVKADSSVWVESKALQESVRKQRCHVYYGLLQFFCSLVSSWFHFWQTLTCTIPSFLSSLKGAQKHLYLPMVVTATKAAQAPKSAEANVLVIFPENCDFKDQRSLKPW